MVFFLFSFPPAGKKKGKDVPWELSRLLDRRGPKREVFFSFISPFRVAERKNKRWEEEKKIQAKERKVFGFSPLVGKVPPAHSDASVSLPHVFVRDKKTL